MADAMLEALMKGGGIGAMNPAATGGGGGTFADLLKDRNFLSLLAGMGSRFDPRGAGGAIGIPTQQMIQSIASQEALKAGESKRDKFNAELLRLLGGLGPKEQEGLTTAKIGQGNISLDITPPGGAALPQPSSGEGVPFTPQGGLPPIAPGEDIVSQPAGAGRAAPRLSDAINFY